MKRWVEKLKRKIEKLISKGEDMDGDEDWVGNRDEGMGYVAGDAL